MHITPIELLCTPQELAAVYPMTPAVQHVIDQARLRVATIVQGRSSRLLVVIGPCSVHDPSATLEYAGKLRQLQVCYRRQIEIVMRTYFEKPRTILGWQGLISEPDLNGHLQLNRGLQLARKLLLQINQLELPTATEFLEPWIVPYMVDFITWGAIGARTSVSSIHRQLVAALPCPVGFKNSIQGDWQVAIQAMLTAQAPQKFLGPNAQGQPTVYQGRGNAVTHLILRGGRRPNYQAPIVQRVCQDLQQAHLLPQVMVDCSHGNCQHREKGQLGVGRAICQQIRAGSAALLGVMVESFLVAGQQPVIAHQPLVYGQSITDPCIDWSSTQLLLEQLANAVEVGRKLSD